MAFCLSRRDAAPAVAAAAGATPGVATAAGVTVGATSPLAEDGVGARGRVLGGASSMALPSMVLGSSSMVRLMAELADRLLEEAPPWLDLQASARVWMSGQAVPENSQ